MSRGDVAVAIPAYRAAPWIAAVVEGVGSLSLPVLVIDDGSDDGTGEVASNAGAAVRRLPVNQGKGAALRVAFDELFSRQGYAAVVTLDADGQHDPAAIPQLVEAWRQGADLVLGTRDRVWREMGVVRRVSNRLSSRAISILAGVLLADVQTGFRAYSRELVEAVGFPGNRFEAESAVVIRAVRRGYRIEPVPVRHSKVDGRASSHYRPLRDSLRIAVAVIRARVEEAR